jgi:putative nucleotidyltransferase with HDIG domain
MRALSLAARTKYRIHNDLLTAMRENRNLLKTAPIEGIREELNRILLSSKPSRYFKIMRKIGVLDIILPELSRCYGVKQDKRHHKHDVFRHCLYTCDYIEPDLILRLAAILHDIGKTDTRAVTSDRITFHKHEIASVELSVRALKRLRYKKEIIDKTSHLIKFHMYHYTREFSDAAVRRFIKKIVITAGDLKDLGNIPLFKLRKAERKGNGYKTIPVTERQLDFENRIREVFESSKGLYINDLNIDGDTIMKMFNMEQSPKVGEVLNYLLEQILEKPKTNNMDDLIKMAAEFIYYKMK